jgi:hypothetical protein
MSSTTVPRSTCTCCHYNLPSRSCNRLYTTIWLQSPVNRQYQSRCHVNQHYQYTYDRLYPHTRQFSVFDRGCLVDASCRLRLLHHKVSILRHQAPLHMVMPEKYITNLNSAYPPRKRMRLDESNSSFHDFNAPYYSSNDYWPQDLSHSFSSAQFSSTSQPMTASASPAIKTKARQEKASKDLDEIAVCRWNDEVTG